MRRCPHANVDKGAQPATDASRMRTPVQAALLVLLLSLCAPPLAWAEPDVGVVGPNVLVRPLDVPAVADRARLTAAGNESESVQVVIRASDAPLASVDVDVVGVLAGPGGATIPASAIAVSRVGYYDATGLPSDGDLNGALGSFPDILIPRVDSIFGEARTAFPIDVPSGQNRLAWVDVHVPPGAPAGSWSGASIRVRAGGALLRTIPIELQVLGLDLPSTTSLDGGFDINPNRVCQAHPCGSIPGGAAAVTAMYARIALDNRLTLAKPPNPTPSGPSDPSYRTYTRPLLVGSSETRLRGARLRTVTIYQWARESGDEWRQAAEADGFVDRVRFHCDEIARSAAAWSSCRDDWSRANALWRGAASGADVSDLPLQVTTSIDDVAWARANGFADLADRIAVLVPVINRVHPKSFPAFPGRRAEFTHWTDGVTPGGAQRRLWSYTSCMSMGCSPSGPDPESEWRGWPSYGVDQPATQARAMGWISYTYALSGEYYYETARDLPGAWTSLWSADGGNHGDGTLFYPGTPSRIGGTRDIPLESIRLKRIRDGREDYEWLTVASAGAGRAEVEQIARSVFDSAHATDVSQARLEAARAQLATIIAGRATREFDFDEPVIAKPPTTDPAGGDPVVDRPKRPASVAMRRARCLGRVATIVGTQRADTLRGTRRRDVIVGRGGADRIFGLGAGDVVCAGPGNDLVILSGDRGSRDVVSCSSGRDRVLHDRRDRVLANCERRTRRR